MSLAFGHGLRTALAVYLLTAPLGAATIAELYQAAVTAEKGQGDLEKAIALYDKVVAGHGTSDADQILAARAQIRIGVCREKLGLKAAREAYQQVAERFADQPQAAVAAAELLVSLKRREALLAADGAGSADTGQYSALNARRLLPDQSDSLGLLLRQNEAARTRTAGWSGEYLRQAQVSALRARAQALREAAPEVARELLAWAEQVASLPAELLHQTDLPQYGEYALSPPVVPYAHRPVAELPREWRFQVVMGSRADPQDQGREYSGPAFDDSHWSRIQIGRAWEDQGYQGYDQGAWYRTRFQVEADDRRPVYMAFGGVDLHGYVYLNGQYVGEHHEWDLPFILDVSAAVQRHGENTVAIYVYDGMGMGGFYGLIGVHQPTGTEDGSRFVGSQAPSVRRQPRRFWRGMTLPSGEGAEVQSLYAIYAQTQPLIPYPHRTAAKVPLKWRFALDPEPFFRAEKGRQYSQLDYADDSWALVEIGRAWEDQGYPDYDGGAWYRTTIEVDAAAGGAPVCMAFGGIDEDAYVCVNGKLVGEFHQWDEPFLLDLSEAVDRHGPNAVAIYVYGGFGMGGIYGRIDVHQPTGEEDLDRLVANRGGRVLVAAGSGLLRRWLSFGLGEREDYSGYALTRPSIPYPAQSVAVVPLRWRFSTAHERVAAPSLRDFDDSDWPWLEIGRAWEDQGYAGYDKGAWYRARIEVNTRDDRQPVYMAFGGVDRDAWIYVNGQLVGEHHEWNQPFIIDITQAVVRHGPNVVAIYVYDGFRMGGIYGDIDIHQRLDQP
ncbi:MAG: sugar-binding domain-containing protein [Candidatus Latescibacterota bacterium]